MLKFPKKKNSGKGVTPLSTPKKDKNRFALFFLGEGNQVENTGGGKFFKLEERIYTPVIPFDNFAGVSREKFESSVSSSVLSTLDIVFGGIL